MMSFEKTMQTIRSLDAEFLELTGRNAYGHVSEPSPGDERFAFHDGTVVGSRAGAVKKMEGLVEVARSGEADSELWW